MPIAFVLTAELTAAAPSAASPRVVALNDDAACQAFRRWFAAQPGSHLVLSATNAFNEKFARPRKPDNILNYSPTPTSNDKASWYKAMKHYRTNVGNERCISASYDAAHKVALIFSENGTGSDLTLMTVPTPPARLPLQLAPGQTRNGVRLGMTVAQVQAIDGQGTLRPTGPYQQLMYSQDIKKTADFVITAYLGFLFKDGKLVAADVGGGV